MKLPSFKRLNKNDYPKELASVIDKLSFSLNVAIDSLNQLANNQISFGDNMYSDIATVTVRVDSRGNPLSTTSINLKNITTKVIGTIVKRAINNDNSTGYPTSGVLLSFTQNGNSIIINNITGLIANNSYTLTVQIDG